MKKQDRSMEPSAAIRQAMIAADPQPDVLTEKTRFTGKRFKRSFSNFLFDLFFLNEELPPKQKHTDEVLRQMLFDEYSHYPVVKARILSGKYSISFYRNYYNNGRLVPNRVIERISFRYGYGKLQGVPVNLRSGTRPFTGAEIRSHIKRYRGISLGLERDLPKGAGVRKLLENEGLDG